MPLCPLDTPERSAGPSGGADLAGRRRSGLGSAPCVEQKLQEDHDNEPQQHLRELAIPELQHACCANSAPSRSPM
jgi:hypothetical protein